MIRRHWKLFLLVQALQLSGLWVGWAPLPEFELAAYLESRPEFEPPPPSCHSLFEGCAPSEPVGGGGGRTLRPAKPCSTDDTIGLTRASHRRASAAPAAPSLQSSRTSSI